MTVTTGRTLKKHIENYKLQHRQDVISFIKNNPENLAVHDLSRIAELVNSSRHATAAYYTDDETLRVIYNYLPEITKNTIRVLEPSVGVGNFIQPIINKYKNATKLIIDVIDIDEISLDLLKVLNKYRDIPSNVEINYYNDDFLNPLFFDEYDLVIGNPPFLKLSQKTGLASYSVAFNDTVTKNMSGFFIQKATEMADNVVMIQPKYFLSNQDFTLTRERINNYAIDVIIDFGEKGFKGVLIETIALVINTNKIPETTLSYSVTLDKYNEQLQSEMTDDKFPYWLIYRNKLFNKIAQQMQFNVFTVFRDRQLTNSVLLDSGEVQVLKSRNLKRDGSGFVNLENYDKFIDKKDVEKYTVGQYLDRSDVFLSPNMTYYPRVIKKPQNTLVNGSVAILEKKENVIVKHEHLDFLNSSTFEQFYRIARNYSTRSLNIDKSSVFFFGLYNEIKT